MVWWDDEHRTITHIAGVYLTDHSRQQINQLIGKNRLAALSLWADRIKSQQRWAHTRSWHYVNIDRGQSAASFEPKNKGDIFWALEHFYRELGNHQLPTEKRRQALLFFIHFVADIHQPLHVGGRKDRGGNRVAINWFASGKIYNLHQVWDGLLTKNNLPPSEYAQRLLKGANKQQIRQWRGGSFKDWALESHQLLADVYNFGVDNKDGKPLNLGIQYLHSNKPLAERRILQAGIRLADYLNRAFADKNL